MQWGKFSFLKIRAYTIAVVLKLFASEPKFHIGYQLVFFLLYKSKQECPQTNWIELTACKFIEMP